MNWDYTTYEPQYVDVIWASPPCIEYSCAKTIGIRHIDKANQIVKKTLEIIAYLKPKHWMIENPQTGLLKTQVFMLNLPYNDIDYCKYGMPYRKRTRIWNNLEFWEPRPLCKKDCGNTIDNKHMAIAQRGPSTTNQNNQFKQSELYRIPQELIREILASLNY